MWAWVFATAIAGVPEGVRPVAAAIDAPQQYAAHRQSSGLPPSELSCEDLWPGSALLCFRLWEGKTRRWVTADDLARWKVTTAELRTHLVPQAAAYIEAAEWVDVQGMPHRYLRVADGDGWAVAGVLYPEGLVARLGGGPVRVALPAEGVLFAWLPAGVELDKVMAVGTKETFEAQPGGVTPLIHQWDGEAWKAFGQAVPESESPPR